MNHDLGTYFHKVFSSFFVQDRAKGLLHTFLCVFFYFFFGLKKLYLCGSPVQACLAKDIFRDNNKKPTEGEKMRKKEKMAVILI